MRLFSSFAMIFNVDYLDGDSAMMSTVLEFPPNESCRILVSLLSLYGTCVCLSSVSALMT